MCHSVRNEHEGVTLDGFLSLSGSQAVYSMDVFSLYHARGAILMHVAQFRTFLRRRTSAINLGFTCVGLLTLITLTFLSFFRLHLIATACCAPGSLRRKPRCLRRSPQEGSSFLRLLPCTNLRLFFPHWIQDEKKHTNFRMKFHTRIKHHFQDSKNAQNWARKPLLH